MVFSGPVEFSKKYQISNLESNLESSYLAVHFQNSISGSVDFPHCIKLSIFLDL